MIPGFFHYSLIFLPYNEGMKFSDKYKKKATKPIRWTGRITPRQETAYEKFRRMLLAGCFEDEIRK